MSSTVWDRFERALADVLSALTEDQFLVVKTREGNRFVQFAGRGGEGMRAEAASNRVLTATERLDPHTLDRLDALGWSRPTHDLDEDDEHDDGSCNFYFDYAPPVPWDLVAQQAVRTLTEVFRVQHINELLYSAFDDNGPRLLLPSLGIELDTENWPHDPAGDHCLDPGQLRQRVFEVLEESFEGVRDESDDVRVPFGLAEVIVRVIGDPPVINVFVPIVEGVVGDSRLLLAELNERNMGCRFVRFIAVDDTVIVSHDLFGRPFVPAHLVYAVSLAGDLVTSIDETLCDRFGGHSFFPETDGDT